MSLLLCLAAFFVCLFAGRRSLVAGLTALISVGYTYGIVRANLPETYSHFIFDAGVLGFYSTQLVRASTAVQEYRIRRLKPWLEFVIAWPLLLFLVPNQDILIRLVGLRGNIFLLPMMIIGARLEGDEKYKLAVRLAILNLAAFAFASAEFATSVERFFPRNEVTRLIYISKDVLGHTAYRIPSTFAGSHAYAGTMVVCLPFLLGALQLRKKQDWHKPLLIAGLIASLLGVFMAATRLHFVAAAMVVAVAAFSIRSRFGHLLVGLMIIAGIAWVVSSEQRLQRFAELQEPGVVTERVAGSVNIGFFDLAATYPFGNGLGGGGTSIPYFLTSRIENPVGIENEYARIMLEQGLIGLGLWIAFMAWLLTRQGEGIADRWFLGRRLAWVTCAACFATGLLGTGLFTSIPQTCLLFLNVGWLAALPTKTAQETFLAARPPDDYLARNLLDSR